MAISLSFDTKKEAEAFVRELNKVALRTERRLVRDSGRMARDLTRRKIKAGNFAEPSKWVKAKKGRQKALRGVAEKVVMKIVKDDQVQIESSDPRYTLAQHQKGYTKRAGTGGIEDNVYGNYVRLPLKNPGALQGKVSNPFIFNWTKNKRPSVVPARDILPTDRRLAEETEKIAGRWINRAIREAARRSGVRVII